MKNFKTKITIVLCSILCSLIFLGCIKIEHPKTQTKWVITDIVKSSRKGICHYFVRPIESLSVIANTWFVDSIGKFNVDDTLSFNNNKEIRNSEILTKWIIANIQQSNVKGICHYFVKPIESTILNNKGLLIESTCFVDSIGKFNVDDTLSFDHCR